MVGRNGNVYMCVTNPLTFQMLNLSTRQFKFKKQD